jgi:hypothetical protein
MLKLKDLLPECENCGRDWNHGHDHEASMAHGELRDAISNASKIQAMFGNNDNLPGWVSSYITLASDYLHSVAEYMAEQNAEMSQEPGPGFNMMENIGERTFVYKDARGNEKYVTAAHADEAKAKVKRFGGDVNSVKEKSVKPSIAPKKMGFEEAKKPSAGLSAAKKSAVAKKAHAGKDVGKKGKGFEKIEKAAEKKYGSKEAGEKVAAAAMWKNVKR